nr:uncharacterized protein LOC111502740 [Leptinotarsa decemlineata]
MISSSSSETYDKYESDKKQEPFEPGDRQEGNPSEKETNEEREYEPFEQEDRQEGDLSEKEAVEEREYESLEPQDRQEVNPSEKETVEEREYEPLESQDRQEVNPTEKETVEEREYEKSLLSELEFEDDEEKKVIVSEYVENETRKAQKISKTGTKSSKKSKKQKRKNRSKRKLTTTSIEGNIERKDFIVVENLTAQQKFLKASIASCMEFLTPDDLLDDDCPETFIFSDDEKNTSGGSSTDTGSETMDLDDENINPPIMNPEIKSTSTGTENITKRSKRAKKNRKNKTKKKGAEADKLLHNNENQSDKENHPPQTNISEGATKSYVVYLKNDEHFADDDLKQYCDERDRVHEISCSSTETSSETLEFMNNDEDAFSDTILERSFRRIDKKRPKDEENFEQQVYKTSTKQCIKTIPREEYDDGARGGDWIVDSAKHKKEERIEFLWVETPCGQFKCLVDNCGFISESQDEQVQHLDEHKDIFY